MSISDDLAELSRKMLCTCQHFKAVTNLFHFLTDLLLSLRNRQKKTFAFHGVGDDDDDDDDVVAPPPSRDSSYIVKNFGDLFYFFSNNFNEGISFSVPHGWLH